MKRKKYYGFAKRRKIDRLIRELNLKIKLSEYAFLSTYDSNVKYYKKGKRQIDFMLKYKNHKCIINQK